MRADTADNNKISTCLVRQASHLPCRNCKYYNNCVPADFKEFIKRRYNNGNCIKVQQDWEDLQL